MELDTNDREEFLSKADDLFEDFQVGEALSDGEPDALKELICDMEGEDLKTFMEFLIEEEVISFD